MTELTLRELQLYELDILKYFHSVCEEYGLRYYLAGGTLLGAVRHKGFIPWDDDIDVIMPRKDYIQLHNALKGSKQRETTSTEYIVLDEAWIRLMDTRFLFLPNTHAHRSDLGIWIDIFPSDGMPSNKLIMKLHFLRLRFLRHCIAMITLKPLIKRKKISWTILQYFAFPFRPLLRQIGTERIANRLNKLAQKYDFEKCEFVGVVVGGNDLKEILVKDEFLPRIKLPFEDGEFYVSKNYDTYLKQIYGDYMQLPPENKRAAHHARAWWRETEDMVGS